MFERRNGIKNSSACAAAPVIINAAPDASKHTPPRESLYAPNMAVARVLANRVGYRDFRGATRSAAAAVGSDRASSPAWSPTQGHHEKPLIV